MQKAISNFIFTNQNCLDSENNNKQKNKTSWLVIKFKCQNSKLVVGSIEQLTYQEPQPDFIDWYMIWLHLIYLVWVLYKPVKLDKFPAVKKHDKSKQLQRKQKKKYIYISLTLMVFRWFERLQWIKMRTPVLISITGQKIDFPKKFCNKNI